MWSPARISVCSGASASMLWKFWNTASAVPWYQSSCTRFMGGSTSMYSPSSAEKMFQPSRMCRIRSSDLYCVRMKIRRTSELMQLERVKSMIR